MPAILDLYQIAWPLSDPLVMAPVRYHKGVAEQVLPGSSAGIPTPRVAVIERGPEDVPAPPRSAAAVVRQAGGGGDGQGRDHRLGRPSREQLMPRLPQPAGPVPAAGAAGAVVFPGREFTVGITGARGPGAEVIGTLEIVLRDAAEPEVYSYVNKEQCEQLVEYHPAAEEHHLKRQPAGPSRSPCPPGGRWGAATRAAFDLRSDAPSRQPAVHRGQSAGRNAPEPFGFADVGHGGRHAVRRVDRANCRVRRHPRAPDFGEADPLRVVILHNAIPPDAPESEQDTLVQVEAVRAALLSRGHDVSVLACTLDLETCRTRLIQAQPAVVFNLVEGLGGADRLAVLAPALLDALRIPYTGNRTEPLCLSNHKLLTKQQLRAAGLPTPDWESLSHAPPGEPPAQFARSSHDMPKACAERLRAPYIVKTVSEHASFGLEDDFVVLAEDGRDVQDRLHCRDPAARVASVLRSDSSPAASSICPCSRIRRGFRAEADPEQLRRRAQVLPPAEIDFSHFPAGKPQVVGYRAKWSDDSFEFHHTPRCFDFPAADSLLLERLTNLAAQCWSLLGLRGYVRVDFRVDAEGDPWVLEINTNPCISHDAGFVAAARAGRNRL